MLGISLLDTGITFIEKVVSTSQPATKTMKRDISGHRFLRIGSMYVYLPTFTIRINQVEVNIYIYIFHT